MKTKLLILLSLLLSLSFADAMSVKVSFAREVPGSCSFEFKYTHENGFVKTERFELEMKGAVIIVSETNKKTWNQINLILSEKLKLKTTDGSLVQFEPNIQHTHFPMYETFEDLFIGNDYMITMFEEVTNSQIHIFTIFAYRQD